MFVNSVTMIDTSPHLTVIDADTTNPIARILQSTRFKYIAQFPTIFETGFSYQIFRNWVLYAGVEYQKWQLRNENADIVNYHLGSSFSIAKPVELSLGYFTQYDPYRIFWDWAIHSKEADQKFLSLGMKIHLFNAFSISLAALDSHLLKTKDQAEKYLQTYYSIGVAIQPPF